VAVVLAKIHALSQAELSQVVQVVWRLFLDNKLRMPVAANGGPTGDSTAIG